MMIKIIAIRAMGHQQLELGFSDGSSGAWSAAALIERDTVLTRPLTDPAYFAERAFIEGGALAWPNGLEFSPAALHAELEAAGLLRQKAA